MKTKAELKSTKNYDLFRMNPLNRPLHENPTLEKSMQQHGFMASCAIHCKRAADGGLIIIRGHHRFTCAKRLGLPVYYIVDETEADIFDFEGGATQNWNASDFAFARAQAGSEAYATLLEFRKNHCLTMGAAVALVAGRSGGSGSNGASIKNVKNGSFRVGDMKHANDVVAITDLCREKQIAFATSTAFVRALSMALRVPEFDANEFRKRVATYPANLRKRGSWSEYLEEIEAFYNYTAKTKRLPLKFRAIEVSRDRQRNFGRSVGQAKARAASTAKRAAQLPLNGRSAARNGAASASL